MEGESRKAMSLILLLFFFLSSFFFFLNLSFYSVYLLVLESVGEGKQIEQVASSFGLAI